MTILSDIFTLTALLQALAKPEVIFLGSCTFGAMLFTRFIL